MQGRSQPAANREFTSCLWKLQRPAKWLQLTPVSPSWKDFEKTFWKGMRGSLEGPSVLAPRRLKDRPVSTEVPSGGGSGSARTKRVPDY